jgi:hypothetical protein
MLQLEVLAFALNLASSFRLLAMICALLEVEVDEIPRLGAAARMGT